MKKDIWFVRLIPLFVAAAIFIVLAIIVAFGRKQNLERKEVIVSEPERVQEQEPVEEEPVAKQPIVEIVASTPDAVEQPVRVEAEVTDPVEACAERIGDLFREYFNSRGLPVESYTITDCYEVGANKQVYVSFDNTNAMAYCIVSPDGDILDYDLPSPMYGSDYTIIYFTQGVPDNIRQIENTLYEHSMYEWYISDYRGGDTIELVDGITQESILVDLE